VKQAIAVLVVLHYFHDVASQKLQRCIWICQSYVQNALLSVTVYKFNHPDCWHAAMWLSLPIRCYSRNTAKFHFKVKFTDLTRWPESYSSHSNLYKHTCITVVHLWSCNKTEWINYTSWEALIGWHCTISHMPVLAPDLHNGEEIITVEIYSVTHM